MSSSRRQLLLASVLLSIGFSSTSHAQVNSPTTNRAATVIGKIRWKSSTQQSQWVDKADVPLGDKIPVPSSPIAHVYVNSKLRQQVIDGWGGCFNERGQKALEALTPQQRAGVMRSLFDPKTGLKLNMGRTPIGASDYAVDLYSLNETPGDYAMKNFNIARDQQLLIPYIKAALAIRPDLKMWAVPWSPPSWMKTNNNLVAGNIKDDSKTLDALALYFARYIQAYKAAGINIGMVMPQNEPNISSNYTSCQWTGQQLAQFIGTHLGPQLRKNRLGTDIFLGTINDSSRGGYAYWVGPSMQNPDARKYLSGVGCQWDAAPTMSETHFLYPELKLMQTEAECGKTNSNDWGFAEYQYGLAKKWFDAGASSNILWNLVLDETGLSTGGWAQCSPVVIDTKNKQVIYTPFYYCYKHFSYFVQPGARVVDTQSTWGDKVAFINPDGEIVVVMGNSANIDLPVVLDLDGKESQTITLPAHSFNTFTYSPKSR